MFALRFVPALAVHGYNDCVPPRRGSGRPNMLPGGIVSENRAESLSDRVSRVIDAILDRIDRAIGDATGVPVRQPVPVRVPFNPPRRRRR